MDPIAYTRRKPRLSAFLGAPLALALAMNGCLSSPDRDAGARSPGDASATLDPARGAAALESMGYAKDRIKRVDGGFIVEGDMFFGLADLIDREGAPLPKTAQRQSTPVSSANAPRVTVSVHPSLSAWFPIVSQAVNQWNSVNTRLHLTLLTGGGSITLYSDTSAACPVNFRNLAPNIGGIAATAAGGSPGAAICMNMDAPAYTNDRIRVMATTHELGHTLGFRHTDTNDGTLIPGTPAVDDNSIMGSGGNFSYVLSPDDIKALEIIYPSDKPLGGTDLDGDLKDDIVVWRPSDGTWRALTSASGFTSGISSQWGQRGDMPMADMDLDGDGKDDKVIWRPGDGFWHAVLSATNTVRSVQWGQTGDIPVPNVDMDGDRKTDLVVWRWKDGKFYVIPSTTPASGFAFALGAVGDIPVGGIDADRDGRDDLVVWRPSDTKFYIKLSGSGFATTQAIQQGQLGETPVGGTDPDRDGKDDLTTWRPGGGAWFSLGSASNFATQKIVTTGFVYAVPVSGTDIDKDGLRDLAIWNPGNGNWIIKNSATNFTTTSTFAWGQ